MWLNQSEKKEKKKKTNGKMKRFVVGEHQFEAHHRGLV